MFQYYNPEERPALEQIAERIDTLERANWHGYQGADILEPHLHRGIRNGRRLNDYQWYPLYREVVEGYPTFLDLRHFDNKWDSKHQKLRLDASCVECGLVGGVKAFLWLGLLEYSGELSANYEESRNNPIHRPTYRNLLPTDRREPNQHAGSSDDEDSDDQKSSESKFLCSQKIRGEIEVYPD